MSSGWKRALAKSTRFRDGGLRKHQECDGRVERRRARFGGSAGSAFELAMVGLGSMGFGTVIPLSAKWKSDQCSSARSSWR